MQNSGLASDSVNNQKVKDSDYKTSKGYKEKIVPGNMDIAFFIIVLILLVFGLVMMFSASYARAIYETGDPFQYFRKQAILAACGIVAMLIISKIDYHIFQKKFVVYGAFLGSIFLLVLVLLIGKPKSGTTIKRWLEIGPISFQPSELMKAALIILFAYLISINHKKLKQFKYGILPFFIILGVVGVLMMLEPHLSGTVIICLIGFVMIFVGGANIKHIIGLGITGICGFAALLVYFASTNHMSYLTDRVNNWLYPFEASAKDAWQTQQSLIAIGSGGLFGLGLGNSRQKFLYLPESENDFVFAVVCEELGFIGAMIVILIFALFIFRGFYISAKAPDKFGMMLCVGLTTQIGVQALLNIAVVTNSIPNTGISLPFFSYGGTALLMQLAEMGIILNISRQSMIET